mgnify:FL=1
MTIIAPSLLSADFLNLQRDVEHFNAAKDLWFHLDLMDGHYVPNLTFGKTVLKDLHKVTNHKLDAHLMVSNPQDYVEVLSDIGIHNFTFHWETVSHQDCLVREIKKLYPSVGISLNPATPIEMIPTYIFDHIDLLLIMSVNPGFGGQSFIDGVIDKIKKAKKIRDESNLNFHIQVDGGINDKNAPSLVAAGASILVAGSYIFNTTPSEYLRRVNSLR